MIRTLIVLLVLALLGTAAFVGLGVYNVAADDPHWPITYRFMDTLRDRSIAVRAADVEVPELDDDALVRSGAGNYNSMCVGCHLSPGASDTEISMGLYPAPPTWSELGAVPPREAFWVVKHGIKMSGMPAWGKSMEDRYIWAMVALMQRFPRMTAADYEALVSASPGHSHGGGESDVDGGDSDEHAIEAAADEAPRSSFEPTDDPMTESGKPAAEAPPHDDDHGH